jgi:hypothetical protein
MSGEISIYGAAHFARVLFGKSETPKTTYYLALINGADPSGYITGAELDEVSGGSYARQALANNTSVWHEQDFGRMANTGVLSFPTASADWGRIRSWALCDAATGGNILFYGQFKASKNVKDGDTFMIDNGALSIELLAGV